MIQTEVLVVGCGPAGLTAALALARLGVKVLAITKHQQLAPTPRAHFTNQRTFEILRELGLEKQAMALAVPYTAMPDLLFLRSLTGPEFGRIRGLGVDDANNMLASPSTLADLSQTLMEPLLFDAAMRAGAQIRFSTEMVSFTQTEECVDAVLHDRATGENITVQADYMVGADGGRSPIASALDLPFEGPGKIGGSLNILFECDLSPWVAHRPGMLYFLVRTAQDKGGVGLGFLRCIKPWTSWMLTQGYAAGEATPGLSAADAVEVIRDYLAIPGLEPRVSSVDPWNLNSHCATRYQLGRVFCMGDAVHRHAPSNGLGSNTAIQDAWNLAWKLHLVLNDKAGAGLLDSYSEERVPVGQQVVDRATKSVASYPPVLHAIGVTDFSSPDSGSRNMAELAAPTKAGTARRKALQEAIGAKVYEYRARGLELNQFYRSSAVADEGQKPAESAEDLELIYRATTCPGAHLPHAWVQKDGHTLSTLDLVGRGRFTILTGIGGEKWAAAATAAAAHFAIEIAAVAIGPGCAITDLYFNWERLREIAEDGCLLVRPDGYIAWRCHSAAETNPEQRLYDALAHILDRGPMVVSAHEKRAGQRQYVPSRIAIRGMN